VAAQVFGAAAGTVIGPIPSSTGFDVIKVESIAPASGRSLAAARAEIAAKLTEDKRKDALADLVTRIEDQLGEGRTFEEVAQANRLPVLATPALTRAGTAPDQPAFRLPPEYAGMPRFGFDLGVEDEPVVESLPNEAGYALLDVTEVVPASPAPLARIADQVRRDFVQKRAADRANAAASRILAATARGTSLADAVRAAGVQGVTPAEPIDLRRGQLAQFAQSGQDVPPPLRILFTLAPGKAQRAAGPSGIYLVRLNRVIPGTASLDPTLIARETTGLNRSASEELAVQWLSAAQKELGVTRNEDAIRAARQRIFSGS
jgi:peptidyl-prolyl cis-trans isomerase D